MHRVAALTSAGRLSWIAAAALLVALGAWMALLLTDLDLVVCLAIAAATGTIGAVAGAAGVWVHRIHPAVSVLATAWYAAVAAVLIATVVANVPGAVEGGFTSIGGGMLLIVGTVVTAAATAVAGALVVVYAREQLSARGPGVPSMGAR